MAKVVEDLAARAIYDLGQLAAHLHEAEKALNQGGPLEKRLKECKAHLEAGRKICEAFHKATMED